MAANQVVVQAGYFNSDSSNIGLSEGFMMSSGGVVSAIGPNDAAGNTVPGIGMVIKMLISLLLPPQTQVTM